MTVFKLSVMRRLASSVSASAVSRTSEVTTGGKNGAKLSPLKFKLYSTAECLVDATTNEWLTSTHSRIAIAAVRRTTASDPGPWSCSRCTRTCQSFGLFAVKHSSDTSLPRSHAILRFTMG